MKSYCVYIMAGKSGVLYIGVTNDLERRVVEHKQKTVPGFTARYNLTKLVYFEFFGDIRQAITREKQLKGWLRKRKLALIESVNAEWKDLSPQWCCLWPRGRHPPQGCGRGIHGHTENDTETGRERCHPEALAEGSL
jgi:putative endonuclease